VTLLIARASWRWFEQPLIRRGHSYSYWTQDAEVAAYGGQTAEHGLKSMPRVGSEIEDG
jgi:hypothetical protein